jgi:hypothetical protein
MDEQTTIPAVDAHEATLARAEADREAAIERERVEWVFGLTGGELEDVPWEPFVPAPDEWEWDDAFNRVPTPRLTRATFRYWYEGAPAYAEDSAAPEGAREGCEPPPARRVPGGP